MKTIIYIQDAHDSLEAQENIAKLIHHFVKKEGVRTVFEEGYEGEVPTEKYFGLIQDSKVREKVAYFLMDHLRLGGAEYAHVIRQRAQSIEHGEKTKLHAPRPMLPADFKLIGADSFKLHTQNIEAYRKSSRLSPEIEKDLNEIHFELERAVALLFPKPLKEFLRLQERYEMGQLTLMDYLKQLRSVVGRETWVSSQKSQVTRHKTQDILSFLLSAETSKDPRVQEKLAALDSKQIVLELKKLEDQFVNSFVIPGFLPVRSASPELQRGEQAGIRNPDLKKLDAGSVSSMTSKIEDYGPSTVDCGQIYYYLQTIQLMKKLQSIQVSEEEYKNAIKKMNALDLDHLAEVLAQAQKSPVLISKRWKQSIQEAIRFYETAQARDQSVQNSLETFLNNPNEQTAVLVYGGFHKSGIMEMLRKKNVTVEAVLPMITHLSERHQKMYRELMQGRFSRKSLAGNQMPRTVPEAARFYSELSVWSQMPFDQVRSEIRRLESVAAQYPGKYHPILAQRMEQAVRSEVRKVSYIFKLDPLGFGLKWKDNAGQWSLEQGLSSVRYVFEKEIPSIMNRYRALQEGKLEGAQIDELRRDIYEITQAHFGVWGLGRACQINHVPYFKGSYIEILRQIFNDPRLGFSEEGFRKFREANRVHEYDWTHGKEICKANIRKAVKKFRPDIIEKYENLQDGKLGVEEIAQLKNSLYQIRSDHFGIWKIKGVVTSKKSPYWGDYRSAILETFNEPRLELERLGFGSEWHNEEGLPDVEVGKKSIRYVLKKYAPEIISRYEALEKNQLDDTGIERLRHDIYAISHAKFGLWGLHGAMTEVDYFQNSYARALLAVFSHPRLELNILEFELKWSGENGLPDAKNAHDSVRYVFTQKSQRLMQQYERFKANQLSPAETEIFRNEIYQITATLLEAWGLSGALDKKKAPFFAGSYRKVIMSVFDDPRLELNPRGFGPVWQDDDGQYNSSQALESVQYVMRQLIPNVMNNYERFKKGELPEDQFESLKKAISQIGRRHFRFWGISTILHSDRFPDFQGKHKLVLQAVFNDSRLEVEKVLEVSSNRREPRFVWKTREDFLNNIQFVLNEYQPDIQVQYQKFIKGELTEVEIVKLRHSIYSFNSFVLDFFGASAFNNHPDFWIREILMEIFNDSRLGLKLLEFGLLWRDSKGNPSLEVARHSIRHILEKHKPLLIRQYDRLTHGNLNDHEIAELRKSIYEITQDEWIAMGLGTTLKPDLSSLFKGSFIEALLLFFDDQRLRLNPLGFQLQWKNINGEYDYDVAMKSIRFIFEKEMPALMKAYEQLQRGEAGAISGEELEKTIYEITSYHFRDWGLVNYPNIPEFKGSYIEVLLRLFPAINQVRSEIRRLEMAAAQINRVTEDGVSAALTQHDKAGFLKSSYHARSGNLRKERHQAAISWMKILRFFKAWRSSFNDHKYSFRAFFMLAAASFFVSPWLVQPGSSGIYTEYPPLGSSLKITLYFIISSLLFWCSVYHKTSMSPKIGQALLPVPKQFRSEIRLKRKKGMIRDEIKKYREERIKRLGRRHPIEEKYLVEKIRGRKRYLKVVLLTQNLFNGKHKDFSDLLEDVKPIKQNQEFNPDFSYAVVDMETGKPIGVRLVGQTMEGSLRLDGMAIKPAFRGSRVAAWMMYHAFQKAQQEHIREYTVKVGGGSDKKALRALTFFHLIGAEQESPEYSLFYPQTTARNFKGGIPEGQQMLKRLFDAKKKSKINPYGKKFEKIRRENKKIDVYSWKKGHGKPRAIDHDHEKVDLVDKDRKPTGKVKTRKQVHKDGDWHEAVSVLFKNAKGEVFLHLRPGRKDISEEKLQLSVSGHKLHLDLRDPRRIVYPFRRANDKIPETDIEAAVREAYEETGIKIINGKEDKLKFAGAFKKASKRSQGKWNREWMSVFVYELDDAEEEYFLKHFNTLEMDSVWKLPSIEMVEALVKEDDEPFSNTLSFLIRKHPDIWRTLKTHIQSPRSELRHETIQPTNEARHSNVFAPEEIAQFYRHKKIGITGAAGNIGSVLLDWIMDTLPKSVAAVEAGSQMREFSYYPFQGKDRLRIDIAKLPDPETAKQLVKNKDVIFHLADAVPLGHAKMDISLAEMLATDALALAMTIAEAEKLVPDRRPRIVAASSSEVYDLMTDQAKEEKFKLDRKLQESDLDITKSMDPQLRHWIILMADALVNLAESTRPTSAGFFSRNLYVEAIKKTITKHPVPPVFANKWHTLSKGVVEEVMSRYEKGVCLRFGGVYGPGYDEPMTLPKAPLIHTYMKQAKEGAPISFSPRQKSYLYVEDAVRMLALAGAVPLNRFEDHPRVLNAGASELATGEEIAWAVKTTLRSTSALSVDEAPRDPSHLALDLSQTKKILGWNPEHDATLLSEGIKRTLEWIQGKNFHGRWTGRFFSLDRKLMKPPVAEVRDLRKRWRVVGQETSTKREGIEKYAEVKRDFLFGHLWMGGVLSGLSGLWLGVSAAGMTLFISMAAMAWLMVRHFKNETQIQMSLHRELDQLEGEKIIIQKKLLSWIYDKNEQPQGILDWSDPENWGVMLGQAIDQIKMEAESVNSSEIQALKRMVNQFVKTARFFEANHSLLPPQIAQECYSKFEAIIHRAQEMTFDLIEYQAGGRSDTELWENIIRFDISELSRVISNFEHTIPSALRDRFQTRSEVRAERLSWEEARRQEREEADLLRKKVWETVLSRDEHLKKGKISLAEVNNLMKEAAVYFKKLGIESPASLSKIETSRAISYLAKTHHQVQLQAVLIPIKDPNIQAGFVLFIQNKKIVSHGFYNFYSKSKEMSVAFHMPKIAQHNAEQILAREVYEAFLHILYKKWNPRWFRVDSRQVQNSPVGDSTRNIVFYLTRAFKPYVPSLESSVNSGFMSYVPALPNSEDLNFLPPLDRVQIRLFHSLLGFTKKDSLHSGHEISRDALKDLERKMVEFSGNQQAPVSWTSPDLTTLKLKKKNSKSRRSEVRTEIDNLFEGVFSDLGETRNSPTLAISDPIDLVPSAMKKMVQKHIWEKIPSGSQVLEWGAGEGDMLQFYTKPQLQHLTSLDLNARSLEKLQKRFPEVKTIVADFRKNISDAHGKFDAAISVNALHNAQNEKEIEEMLTSLDSALKSAADGKKRMYHLIYTNGPYVKDWIHPGTSPFNAFPQKMSQKVQEVLESLGYTVKIDSVSAEDIKKRKKLSRQQSGFLTNSSHNQINVAGESGGVFPSRDQRLEGKSVRESLTAVLITAVTRSEVRTQTQDKNIVTAIQLLMRFKAENPKESEFNEKINDFISRLQQLIQNPERSNFAEELSAVLEIFAESISQRNDRMLFQAQGILEGLIAKHYFKRANAEFQQINRSFLSQVENRKRIKSLYERSRFFYKRAFSHVFDLDRLDKFDIRQGYIDKFWGSYLLTAARAEDEKRNWVLALELYDEAADAMERAKKHLAPYANTPGSFDEKKGLQGEHQSVFNSIRNIEREIPGVRTKISVNQAPPSPRRSEVRESVSAVQASVPAFKRQVVIDFREIKDSDAKLKEIFYLIRQSDLQTRFIITNVDVTNPIGKFLRRFQSERFKMETGSLDRAAEKYLRGFTGDILQVSGPGPDINSLSTARGLAPTDGFRLGSRNDKDQSVVAASSKLVLSYHQQGELSLLLHDLAARLSRQLPDRWSFDAQGHLYLANPSEAGFYSEQIQNALAFSRAA